MKFTLIYDGPLPAGRSRRAEYAAKIRNVLHLQMPDLWDNHVILRQLARTARTVPNPGAGYYVGREPIWSRDKLPEYNDPIPPMRDGQTDFCAPIIIPMPDLSCLWCGVRFILHVPLIFFFFGTKNRFNFLRRVATLITGSNAFLMH
jgi:hypothetical protein